MTFTDEQKKLIQEEFTAYEGSQYAGKDKAERQKLGQFFTPPALSIKMAEKFEVDEFGDKDVLDPTCGNGSLLMTCILGGANPDYVFGIELDEKILKQCHERLCSPKEFKEEYGEDIVGNKYLNGHYVPIKNIHHGNALNKDCYIFPHSPHETQYRGCEYKFETGKDDKDIGKVTFINKDSGTARFTFGGIRKN